MTPNSPSSDHDMPAERRKKLDDMHIRELELAGGMEGGMEAGSAGGPSQSDAEKASKRTDGRPGERTGR